ncbi:MAG: PIN domain-containing protein [Pseudomonadota bacterium]|nr:PIN domain-containing protein [Pseudomonadota bacterium]MEC8581711.1 PIN domain-containing protein [Pseudomonadota bacterium]
MGTNHIFVDFENVQPNNFDLLIGHEVQLTVFVGAVQKALPVEIVTAVQKLGDRAQYCTVKKTAPDALDFHIAFYLGQVAEPNSADCHYIISKDKGFDPLLEHMRERHFNVSRRAAITELPFIAPSYRSLIEERIERVKLNLMSRKESLPKKTAALANTINSIFGKTLSARECQDLISLLEKEGHISVDAGAVRYTNNLNFVT